MVKYRRFSTPKEVEDWVNQYYTNEELDELRDDKNDALSYYKGNGYRFINSSLRQGIIDTSEVVDIDSLQQLLTAKSIKESIEVFRFVSLSELIKLLYNTTGMRRYKYPAFLSTTLLREHYSMENIRSGRIPIIIRIPEGTSGTYLPEIKPDLPEYEVLLPYNLELRKVKWNTFEIIKLMV